MKISNELNYLYEKVNAFYINEDKTISIDYKN